LTNIVNNKGVIEVARLTRAELNKDVIAFLQDRYAPSGVRVGMSTPLGKVKGGLWFEVPTLDLAVDGLASLPFFPNSPRFVFTIKEEEALLNKDKANVGDFTDEIAKKLRIRA
jgi:hypothetical protein